MGKWLPIASHVKCFRQEPRSRRLALTASAGQHFLLALRGPQRDMTQLLVGIWGLRCLGGQSICGAPSQAVGPFGIFQSWHGPFQT